MKQEKVEAQSTQGLSGHVKKKLRSAQMTSGLEPLSTVDRISNLPLAIIDRILCYLPVQEAVRTSVLSKEWKDVWVNLSELDFEGAVDEQLVNFVDHVLSCHSGPINAFSLNTCIAKKDFYHIDSWVQILAGRNPKRLVLAQMDDDPYPMPSCLFSYDYLTHLDLYNVFLKVPDNFKGFRHLEYLSLFEFSIDSWDWPAKSEALASLIEKCPNLTTLNLTEVGLLEPFDIKAPKLKCLYLEGIFSEVNLERCPNLEDITFMMDDLPRENTCRKFTCNEITYLGCLSRMKKLHVSGIFLQYISKFHVLTNHPTSSNQFDVLGMSYLWVRCPRELGAALKLLELFSNSKELSFFLKYEEPDSPQVSQICSLLGQSRCWFNELRTVKIKSDWCRGKKVTIDLELEFMKFVLARSPVLEEMIIAPKPDDLGDILMQVERASPSAKFTYYF